MRFEVFMTVRMMMLLFLVFAPCRLVVKGEDGKVCLSEALASTDESARRQNSEEQHHV
jgi:uncharacterized protein (DUF302 family)